jgi:RNA polymerase sigma-70 factor (ECF subfamily)
MLTPTSKRRAEQRTGNAEQVGKPLASDYKFEKRNQSGTCRAGVQVEAGDEELVLRARQGDGAAFAKLTDRYHATCLKRANRILHNHAEAEDQVQNTFMRAFECLDQFRFEGSFSAWLCRILRNQCLMFIRERHEGEFLAVDVWSQSKGRLELVDQLANQEDALRCEQAMNLLRRELARIPPLMRDVIQLRDIEGLSMSEVATRLQRSVPAAKSRLMRGRKELRERLAKYYGHIGPAAFISRRAPKEVEYRYAN